MSCKPMILCLKCSATLVLLLLLQVGYGQYNFSKLDEAIQQNQKNFEGSVVALIYKDGKIIYTKETDKEFRKDLLQPIAASSNWLTTALVMTFVDEGKLSLDDKISSFIPIFESYSKTYITIRDCLAQTTGIESDLKRMQKMMSKNKFENLEEHAKYIAAKNDIINNPGKDFYYGSTGFVIAGRVLEVIAKKKTFDQLMRERIFKPLLMKRGSFRVDTGAENPATGGNCSASDYLNFLAMILNKGTFNGKKVLSEAAVAEMEKIRTQPAMIKSTPAIMSSYNYTMGAWAIEEDGKGNATVLTSPSFTGTMPFVDHCRGYACIFFTKPLKEKEDVKKDLFLTFKEIIDEQISSSCK